MAKKCKYIEKNRIERKCINYFISNANYSKLGTRIMCRLSEWKKKLGVCPYDNSIKSIPESAKKQIKNKSQDTIERFI